GLHLKVSTESERRLSAHRSRVRKCRIRSVLRREQQLLYKDENPSPQTRIWKPKPADRSSYRHRAWIAAASLRAVRPRLPGPSALRYICEGSSECFPASGPPASCEAAHWSREFPTQSSCDEICANHL